MSPRLDDDASDKERTTQAPEGAPAGETRSRADDLPLDVVFDLLANRRRRRVLRFLLESPETTLGDLAEHVAAIENGKPREALTSAERKRVYIGLYQCHLPKMDDADVVDFDEDRKTVELGENARAVASVLRGNPDTGSGAQSGRWTAGLRSTLGRWLRRPR